VSVTNVVAVLQKNAALAREVVRLAAAAIPPSRSCGCGRALEHAILSDRTRIPGQVRERLAPLLARVLGGRS
jgi:hypothetical protein